MMNRVEMTEEMMEQVVGGYSVGQHVEVRTSMWGLFKHTAGGTITQVATNNETGEQLCYVKFDHWYDISDQWISEEYFE